MKKLALVVAFLTIAALPAMAQDNYHYNANMNCSDCHSMHASAHNNLTDGLPITAPNSAVASPNRAINPYYPAPNPGAGRGYLLKADDVCESCHKDQTFAPDVYGDNVNSYIRSAGGVRENATLGGGHLIGGVNPAPGYKSDVINYFPSGSVLECTSCHSPHGGTGFRNLVPYGLSGKAGYSAANMKPTVTKAAAFSSATDVTILNGNTYTFGSGNFQAYYGRDAVVLSRAATPYVYNGGSSSNRIDQFCGVCHGAFHGGDKVADTGTVTNGTLFVRHPTGVATVGSFSSATAASNLKLYQATGVQTAATDSPGCLTCHKAHGNNNPFALIYPSPTGKDTTEEGDGAYKTLCKSCHGMGGSITPF
jgi:cytochrome c553